MIYTLLGGTGTLGHAITTKLLEQPDINIRILARGEHRLARMQKRFHADKDRLSFFVGDIRDKERVRRALGGSDRVILMAALKHVNSCEYNVLEAVETNIIGASNTVQACADTGVAQAVLVSTDKAVEPITNYGATKMVAERIFVYGNSYTPKTTKFHVVRYGNVLASQGSVVELWQHQARQGQITITNPEITRFWWTAEDAATFVLRSFNYARRGDVFVPIMGACSLQDLADLVAPGASHLVVPGYLTEKVHEVLLSETETDKATYVGGLGGLRISTLLPIPEEPSWGTQTYSSALACSPHALQEVKQCVNRVLNGG